MLKSLSYSVTFPNGRKLANNLSFHEGFGAITGPNEAGKSFIIEMMRYGFFGVAALRGDRDDYKDLKFGMEFSLKGDSYKITRTINNAKLWRGADIIAVGTTPVNQKVVSLLGFGLEVFDVACIANQGSLEKLGDMKPTERKRMVDSVIGLAIYDDIAKWAGDQASLHNKEAETIQRMLREPIKPEQPDNYIPAETLKPEAIAADEAQKEVDTLRGWLSQSREEPIVPTRPDITLSPDELRENIRLQSEQTLSIQSLERKLSSIPTQNPDPTFLETMSEAWDRYEAGVKKQAFLKSVPMPEISEEEARAGIEDHEWADHFEAIDKLMVKIDQVTAKGEHECPKCHYHWPVAAAELDEMDGELNMLTKGVPQRPVRPLRPLYYFKSQLEDIGRWSENSAEWEKVKDANVSKQPPMTRLQISQCHEVLKMQADSVQDRVDLEELRSNRDKTDWQSMLNLLLRYDTLLEEYEKQRRAYDLWLVEKDQKDERLNTIWMLAEVAGDLRDQLNRSVTYEAALVRYDLERDAYVTLFDQMQTAIDKSIQWKKAKAAMIRLRVMVKQQLVPSLNKVASHLIKGMTNGQRQTVKVNEEFDIMIDDQKLDTLSGSGKAVANLALRLGLGQVLTNNVFSLFVGDEIDASMDKDRAEATSDTLHSLTHYIKQILLVTHKSPDADYSIELEAN